MQRALWAGKAWRAEAERWIEVALRERGIAVTGAIDQPRIRPWSTLLTVPTDAGLVWFKENCPGQAFEAPCSPSWPTSCPMRSRRRSPSSPSAAGS